MYVERKIIYISATIVLKLSTNSSNNYVFVFIKRLPYIPMLILSISVILHVQGGLCAICTCWLLSSNQRQIASYQRGVDDRGVG